MTGVTRLSKPKFRYLLSFPFPGVICKKNGAQRTLPGKKKAAPVTRSG
jgi:hypothetical protein